MIGLVDEFIFFDTAQYSRGDWRNRNRIKTANGIIWLTIPVGRGFQSIAETLVSDPGWAERHWKTLQQSYARAAYFDHYRSSFESLYLGSREPYLSQVNFRFIKSICEVLGINTCLSWALDDPAGLGKTERLVQLCSRAGATEYLSGPAARAYLDEKLFADAGIALQWMDYSGYPEYRQLYPPFEHRVSVLDLIFNQGPNARLYMRSSS